MKRVIIKKAPKKLQVGGTPMLANNVNKKRPVVPNFGYDSSTIPLVDSTVNKSAPTYDPSLLTNGKFMVSKPDGSMGQWGNPIHNTNSQVPVQIPGYPILNPSDKANSLSNAFYTYGSSPQLPSPAVIKSNNSAYGHYAYGGQAGYGLDLTRTPGTYNIGNPDPNNPYNPSNTLAPVDRNASNIEAEKGETVVGDFDQDGQIEHMDIGGKKHSQGGTPLNVPDDSFIFSDTKKLKMSGNELVPFGKSANTSKKYTPADLAKQYDINTYKAILDNPDSDPIAKRTAQLMINNYQDKLGQLALVQEAKKGFPNGVPSIAQDYLQKFQEGQQPTQAGNIDDTTPKTFKFGGAIKYPDGGDFALPIDPYGGGKTKAGRTTPTGKNNKFNRPQDYLNNWENLIPGISKLDNKTAQSLIYDYTLKNNPDAIKNMWSTYGLTAKGLNSPDTAKLANNGKFDNNSLTPDTLGKLKSAYTDGYFGVRQLDPNNTRSPLIPDSPQNPYTPGLSTDVPVGGNTPRPIFTNNDPHPGDYNPANPTKVPFDYMTPDKLIMNQDIRNLGSIKKYLPWEAPINAVTPTPTFYDPSRELAANSEQQNTEMMYNNQFSGPQSTGARNSQIAGQSATNAANILSRYNSQNVTVANQFAGVNADIVNKLEDAKAHAASDLYNGNVIANQQYDNSKMKLSNDLTSAQANAWNNRAELSAINTNNPYYYTDPQTGKIVFKGGKGIDTTQGSQKAGGYSMDNYTDLVRSFTGKGMTQEQAHDLAVKLIMGDKESTTYKGLSSTPAQTRVTGFKGVNAGSTYPQ